MNLFAAGLMAAMVALLPGCPGEATGPEPSDDAGPNPEPEIPAILGWESVAEVDANIQKRWGFVSVDLGGGKAFVYGGANLDDFGGEVLGDAYLVDSSSGTPVFTPIEAGVMPTPRYCGCGTYDASRNEVILVGGRSLNDFYVDTYVFDVDAKTFTLVPGGGPTAVIGCSATFVDEDDTAYLFGGGSNGGGLLNEMWAWDPDARTWSAVTYGSTVAPIARYDGAMRQLVAGGPLYLFGGFGNGNYLEDLWSFDLATKTWSLVVAEGPGGRRVPWMVAEPSGEGFYVAFGSYGFQEGEVHGDLWRFDVETATWEDLTMTEGPVGRGFTQWIPGGPGVIGVVVGGYDGARPVETTWQLRAPDHGGF